MKLPIVTKAWLVGVQGNPNYDYFFEQVHAKSKGQAKSKCIKEQLTTCSFLELKAFREIENDIILFEGKEVLRHGVWKIIKLREWRSQMESIVKKKPTALVNIYSDQWGTWWRENKSGYTDDKKKAGIYKIQDAWAAVSHCGLEKKISFRIVTNDDFKDGLVNNTNYTHLMFTYKNNFYSKWKLRWSIARCVAVLERLGATYWAIV